MDFDEISPCPTNAAEMSRARSDGNRTSDTESKIGPKTSKNVADVFGCDAELSRDAVDAMTEVLVKPSLKMPLFLHQTFCMDVTHRTRSWGRQRISRVR